MPIRDRLAHAWNAFFDRDSSDGRDLGTTYGGGSSPGRTRYGVTNERTIVSSILTRIAIDAASYSIRHIRLDEKGRYDEDIKSEMMECFTVAANADQAATHFRQDIVHQLLDKGTIAIVPIVTTLNPNLSGGYDIKNMRVGYITQWYPQHVKVNLYNEWTGKREERTLDKKFVAIVENPLYAVMNEPNSTLQRLLRKLALLDMTDENNATGKMDLIIQLPYVVKSEHKREQAEQRRKDIEFQLTGSKYGIAYTDGTEKITQLNRPVENNLMAQVEFLTTMLYGQLGITEEVMNGTADEKTMLNYQARTVEPIMRAIVEAMRRSFLTKTARTQNQWIDFFRDPFKLIPLANMAEIADKMTRNEVVSSNEIRQGMGLPPSKDPKADQLRNSNMPEKDLGNAGPPGTEEPPPE